MARSLRDLIEFLLEEISLCGAQGATPAHILSLIDVFYAQPVRIESDYVNKRTANQQGGRTPKIDRPFKEKVWTWLVKNPEVSVGKDREENDLPLSELLGSEYVWPVEPTKQKDGAQPGVTSSNGNASTVSPRLAYPAGVTAPGATPDATTNEPPNSKPKHHVFVPEERMWLAIAGHTPDRTRILPTEFTLLSIIASQKGNGIIQPELVRLSGQDKRSVPKRTDALCTKGYIEKKPIQFKASRTSLCTLKKFVGLPSYLDGSFKTPADRGKGRFHEAGDVIDFTSFLTNLFKCLQEFKVISRNDLKQELGMADGWRWRILARALRKLERIGCVKRVRAPSQYADKMKTYHPSVVLVRDPTERDVQLFHENSGSLLTPTEEEGPDSDGEDGPELGRIVKKNNASSSKGETGASRRGSIEKAGRIIPKWKPGRSIPNIVFDVINRAGPEGMSNIEVRNAVFGPFFRRPLETLLARITECWQYSQQPHLRHLALIRDTALRGTITHFIHYSHDNFKQMVENGQASWEAVEYTAKATKGEPRNIPAMDAVAHYDEHGFPIRDVPFDLLKGGEATLQECQEAIKVKDYVVSSSDPVAVKLKDGRYGVKLGHRKLPAGSLMRIRMAKKMTPGEITALAEKRKRLGPGVGAEEVDNVPTPEEVERGPKRRKKLKATGDPFAGMSKKEILISQGLDESWTEFCVCVQERTQPGIYLTPLGKRRANGKRQGRPRISRIAVIRSEKLKEFAWFHEPDKPFDPEVTYNKRKVTPALDDLNGSTPTAQELGNKRPRKRRRIVSDAAKNVEREPSAVSSEDVIMVDASNEPQPTNDETAGASDDDQTQSANKRMRPEQVEAVTSTEVDVYGEPQPKRKRGRPRKDAPKVPKAASQKAKQRKDTKTASQKGKRAGKATEKKASKLSTSVLAAPEQLVPLSEDNTTLPRPSSAQGENIVAESATHHIPTPEPNIGVALPGAAAPHIADQSSACAEPVAIPNEPPLSSTSEPVPVRALSSPAMEAVQSVEVEVGPTLLGTAENTKETTPVSPPREVSEQRTIKEGSLEEATPASHTQGTNSRASQEPVKSNLRMRKTGGGSIAFLRKKIVMDIMEKSGGVFPLGTELWYPFTTAWYKAKQTGKPDMRTLKSTVKTLADVGKLRQLTFSGKDPKGIMVTKTIITLSEIQPSDPRVQNMQKAMFSGEPFIPDGVEVDPALRKSRPSLPPGPEKKRNGGWPQIDPTVTVNLHHKPAIIRAQELRRGLAIQRRLLRGAGVPVDPRQRITRLTRIERPSPLRPRDSHQLSASKPLPNAQKQWLTETAYQDIMAYASSQPAAKSGSNRRWRPLSSFHPFAMIMCPTQTFHPSTGTFLTVACPPEPPRRPRSVGKEEEEEEVLNLALADVIENVRRRGRVHYKSHDARTSKCFTEIDAIAKWETTEVAMNLQTENWEFVHHTVEGEFEAAPIQQPVCFDIDPPPPPPPQVYEPRMLRPLKPALKPALPRAPYVWANAPQLPTSKAPVPAPAPKKRRSRASTAAPKSRRISKLTEAQDGATKPELTATPTRDRTTVVRRHRFAKNLPDWVVQKIMVSVAVVRALVGGLEGKMIDWGLVASLFPDYEQKFIKDRGRTIMNKNRLQISKMQSDFQDRYAEAYEKGKVPPIDYGNLGGYDWEWIVDWAKTQLETPRIEKVPSLPASRKQFDSVFEFRKDTPPSLNDMYQYNSQVTIPRKRALLASVPFCMPLQDPAEEHRRKRHKSDRLEMAKTWARANVLAPEESYNPPQARQTLDRILGESLLTSAVQSLQSERVISRGKSSSTAPGRNYDITEFFLNTLGRKRALGGKQLKRAAYFKVNILDEDIRTEGKHDLKYEAEDGDILVIINLVAQGRLVLRPREPPRNKYGLTDGGYETRTMDKNRLRFGIDVLPVTDMYVYGNPMEEITSSIPPPRGDMDRSFMAAHFPMPPPGLMAAPPPPSTSPGKIPIWFDIHRQFIKVVWDLAIGAVIGTVAARPGISTKDIASVVKPTMGEWEIELALAWMASAGFVERTRDSSETAEGKIPGWSVKEWWWFALTGVNA